MIRSAKPVKQCQTLKVGEFLKKTNRLLDFAGRGIARKTGFTAFLNRL